MIPSRMAVVRQLLNFCPPNFSPRAFLFRAVWLLFITGCVASCADKPVAKAGEPELQPATEQREFLVIAHRGASGYRPEHTLAAYQLAIDQGADFIELDLVPTKDSVLIARHENALAAVKLDDAGAIERDVNGDPVVVDATTDVATRPEFANLLRVRTIDGRKTGGWFSEDFTLAQIKTLHARERIPKLRPGSAGFNYLRIPTLDEVLSLLNKPENSRVGAYPELKHPTHFLYGQRTSGQQTNGGPAIKLDTAEMLTKQLTAKGFTDSNRLFIQCFEVATLRRLKHNLLPAAGFDAPLVQLLGGFDSRVPDVQFHLNVAQSKDDPANYLKSIYGPLANSLDKLSTFGGLAAAVPKLADDYAAGFGPAKSNAAAIAETTKALKLELHPYTLRAEPYFLSPLRGAVGGTVEEELNELRALGATGAFIDQPDIAVRWRSLLR